MRARPFVGLLGGFATFPAFGPGAAQLLRRGKWLPASVCAGGSVLQALVLSGMRIAGPAG
ncbi:MAG: hypothetical protein KIS72_10275 [Luteimonas sp.]|nr:hypothetical protein [Luteimonas sp.]